MSKPQVWVFSLAWMAVAMAAGAATRDAALAIWVLVGAGAMLALFMMTWAATSFRWAVLSYVAPASVLLVGSVVFVGWSKLVGGIVMMSTGLVWVAATYWVFTRKGKRWSGVVDWQSVMGGMEADWEEQERSSETLTPVLPPFPVNVASWPGLFSGLNAQDYPEHRWRERSTESRWSH